MRCPICGKMMGAGLEYTCGACASSTQMNMGQLARLGEKCIAAFIPQLDGPSNVRCSREDILMGWGPIDRKTFTNERPPCYAVFNSITNNALMGDERDFVRIREKNSGNKYSNNIIVEPDKQYEVLIYFNNDAAYEYNSRTNKYVGVARNARVAASFPLLMKKAERGFVRGTISSTTTTPLSVWASAHITASEDMSLHYIEGSAKIYHNRKWETSGKVLSTRLFSEKGTFLGLSELNGVILGSLDCSGMVVYTIQTMSEW